MNELELDFENRFADLVRSEKSRHLLDDLRAVHVHGRYVDVDHRYERLSLYRDCSNSILLVYKLPTRRKPLVLAVLGLEIIGVCMLIDQIQGIHFQSYADLHLWRSYVRRLRKVMSILDWERLLVILAEDLALERGLARVSIQKAKHNRYYCYGYVKLPPLKRRYDATARRAGYRRSWFGRYHHKKLKTAY